MSAKQSCKFDIDTSGKLCHPIRCSALAWREPSVQGRIQDFRGEGGGGGGGKVIDKRGQGPPTPSEGVWGSAVSSPIGRHRRKKRVESLCD